MGELFCSAWGVIGGLGFLGILIYVFSGKGDKKNK